jgi:CheY-like chemotaxis protein
VQLASKGSNMNILVVDDDPLAAAMVAMVLEGLGHSVLQAENAIDAAEQLNAHSNIALVVSDMNMPMVSGIDLFRELRAQGNLMPFILLTGDAPEGLLAQEPRLDACLTKDFSLDEALPQVIAQVLAQHPPAAR